MPEILIFILGFAMGGFVVFIFFQREKKAAAHQAQEAYQRAREEGQAQTQQLMQQMKESFGSISHKALSQNTEDFLQLAEMLLSKKLSAGEQSLHGKKELIDQTLVSMQQELGRLQSTLKVFEQDRAQTYGQIAQQLQHTAHQTAQLSQSTEQLKGLLLDTKARGQWGERMAEDLLRLMGLKEGINYAKQETGSQSQRPDFTFWLPQGRKVHMDVKFPLNNYLKYANAQTPEEGERYLAQFLKDVRLRLKEVRSRKYIDPNDQTLDYLLVFIPNEAVYHFIMEQDPRILDEAMQYKTILCSPFTLYAILSVIRQSVDNFSMEARASELREQLSNFRQQWVKYTQSMEKLGRRIEDAQKEFKQLSETRTNQLDKALQKIDEPQNTDRPNTTGQLFDSQ